MQPLDGKSASTCRRRASGLALAALLIVTGGSLLGCRPQPSQNGTPGRIVLPNGTAYEVPALPFERPVTRQAAGLDKQWQEAGAAYRSGDHRQSARLFGDIAHSEKRDPERHDAALYRGISLLMDGRTAEAGEELSRARSLADEIGLAGSVDDYYLGLTGLARNDVEGARASLQQAVDGAFGDEAQALLDQLSEK